uniref:Uncharacterized protein n=1 Tax=Anguilla anguilla TaxID=7936 RepID=A0A0E9SDC3_ANGAN
MWQNRVIEKHMPRTSMMQRPIMPAPALKKLLSNQLLNFL